RMLRRPEARKFLIVISDGAPVDKATIDANDDKALLDRHLRGAIGWITRETPIDLAAIGLKHEVAEYYRNSVRIDNVEDLATTVISLIDTALVSR
ncbi:MAG: cobaltochelatase subunit CobT, partial [Maritimibacter sp.]|nr:cobaltochelatase subunit CobT [Maritimibacter sp.]